MSVNSEGASDSNQLAGTEAAVMQLEHPCAICEYGRALDKAISHQGGISVMSVMVFSYQTAPTYGYHYPTAEVRYKRAYLSLKR